MSHFCANCGKPLNPGARFCRECGTPVPTDTPADSAPTGADKTTAPPGSAVTIPAQGPVLSVEVSDEMPESAPRPSSRSRGTKAAQPRRSGAAAGKAKEKMPGGRKLLALLLAAVDIALLVMILKAANEGKTPEPVVSADPPYSAGDGGKTGGSGGDGEATGGGAGTLSGLEYSTLERPTADDFLWYDEICETGRLPANAEQLTDGDAVIGSWKGYIYYDFRDLDGSCAEEYLNATITVSGSTGSLLLDWYQITWSGEAPTDESGDEDTLFTGTWADGELSVDGSVPIRLLYFFRTDGREQYAFGTIDLSDGATGYIALVRP